MKPSFQTEWHGIRFADFARLSSRELAGAEFYEAFYARFFERHRGWEDLPADWTADKDAWADFLSGRARGRTLAVGCGLGYIERRLRRSNPNLDLHIHEVAETAWRWIAPEFPRDRRLLGPLPDCLPSGARFDFAYLATVDYALEEPLLIRVLAGVRKALAPGAECLVIPGNSHETPDLCGAAVSACKRAAAWALDACGARPRGQFWGWSRTPDEYRRILKAAGFASFVEGRIRSGTRGFYWIGGRA